MTASRQVSLTSGADPRYPRTFTDSYGDRMAYIDVGDGDPIFFLHGNPTSSYLWRNVMPHLEWTGRLVAPDLIGMGDSAKLSDSGPDRYTFVGRRRYLDQLLDRLGVRERATVVVHDRGSALASNWANRPRRAVKGIAYMEAIVQPLTWSRWPGSHRDIFQGFRSDAGEAGEARRPTLTRPVRSPSTASRSTSWRPCPCTATGCPPRVYQSCSSTPNRADANRPPARVLPDLAGTDRGHRPRHPFSAKTLPDQIGEGAIARSEHCHARLPARTPRSRARDRGSALA
jgi:pimeloyl-ACP methyl ester carboxylesterase